MKHRNRSRGLEGAHVRQIRGFNQCLLSKKLICLNIIVAEKIQCGFHIEETKSQNIMFLVTSSYNIWLSSYTILVHVICSLKTKRITYISQAHVYLQQAMPNGQRYQLRPFAHSISNQFIWPRKFPAKIAIKQQLPQVLIVHFWISRLGLKPGCITSQPTTCIDLVLKMTCYNIVNTVSILFTMLNFRLHSWHVTFHLQNI